MRCVVCECFSFAIICKRCSTLLTPTSSIRKIDGVDVYSLYKYKNIKEILHTKHTPIGYRVYKRLSNLSLKPFMDYFAHIKPLYILGIDEHIQNGYSHIAILTHSLKNTNTIILHSKLMANNRVKYSGKTLEFRLNNPRNFRYSYKRDIDVVLVDDIITSGTTIKEAISTLKKYNVNVLFVLTLADANN